MSTEETQQRPHRIDALNTVYQDRNQCVQRVVAQFEGFEKEYFVADYGERAAVVAIRNGEVLLSRQYRLLINDLSYEIPGGRIDQHETPAEAAALEPAERRGATNDILLLEGDGPAAQP